MAAAARKGQQDASSQQVNVQVILRCRPCSKEELYSRTPQVIQCNEAAREATLFQSVGGKSLGRSFHFDRVFGPDSGQQRLYDQAISPIVEEVLDGFNCTIFAYGQTGTGKTYTMEGGDRGSNLEQLSEVAGVIPRAIAQIFAKLDSEDSEYTVKCSFLELYNEETTDLLAVGEAAKAGAQKLRIMEDRNGVVVQGLEEMPVKTSDDIYALLDRGSSKRRTAETLLNKQSSRSHSVFCITVHIREISPEGEEVLKIGKLYLVDLAGSENVSRSGAVDVRAKEAGLINKSLLTLGRVITALVEGLGHVPYRDSKLTRLLRDSLGGRTKTCIIATIAPTVQCQEETLSTLDYAHRAKNIRNRPEVNQKISKTAHIKTLNVEMDQLKAELFATREKNGVYVPADIYDAREKTSLFMTQRVEALEAEVEAVKEAAQQELAATRQAADAAAQRGATALAAVEQERSRLEGALERARVGLEERNFLIVAHERSESSLAAHALDLTCRLNVALADHASLARRVHEGATREASNAQHVASLQQEASQRLTGLCQALATDAGEHETRFQSSQAALQGLKADREAAAAQHQAGLEGLGQQLADLAEAAQQGSAGVASCAAASVETLRGLQTSYAAASTEAAEEAARQLTGSHAAFTEACLAQHLQLEALQTAQRQSAQECFEASQRGWADMQQHMQGIEQAASRCHAAAAETSSSQASALTCFGQSFGVQLEEEKAELQAGISGLLDAFAQRKAQQVGTALAHMQAALSQGTSTVVDRHRDLSGCQAGALQHHKDMGQSAAAMHEEAGQACTTGFCTMAATLAAAAQQGDQTRHAAHSSAAAAAQQSAAHGSALQAALQHAAASVAASEAAAARRCQEAAEAAGASRKRLAEASCARQEADGAAMASLGSLAQEHAGCAAEWAKRARTDVESAHARVQTFAANQFAADPAEGSLPAVLQVEAADAAWVAELRAPSQDQLLASFRAGGSWKADPLQGGCNDENKNPNQQEPRTGLHASHKSGQLIPAHRVGDVQQLLSP